MRFVRWLLGLGVMATAAAALSAAHADEPANDAASGPSNEGEERGASDEEHSEGDRAAPRSPGPRARHGADGDGSSAAEQVPRPPRPPLPPPPPSVHLPWARHVEVGAAVALVRRLATVNADGEDPGVRYAPALGYGIHARWDIVRCLQFSAYLLKAQHTLELEQRPLALPPGRIETGPAQSLAFGGRLGPVLALSERTRIWASGGVGYLRFDFGKLEVFPAGASKAFRIHEQGVSFVEVPLGVGTSFDILRNWLTLDVEGSGAFILGRGGGATQHRQAVDAEGRLIDVQGLPTIRGSFVLTLGLSVVL